MPVFGVDFIVHLLKTRLMADRSKDGNFQIRYWTDACDRMSSIPQSTWRAYCDALNREWIARFWTDGSRHRILKTDLFEEAVGDGVYVNLRQSARQVYAVDCSERIAMEACARYPEMKGIVADVRTLPFARDAFDGVVSTSTLDHFSSRTELMQSMREIGHMTSPACGSNPYANTLQRPFCDACHFWALSPGKAGLSAAFAPIMEESFETAILWFEWIVVCYCR